MKYGNILQKYWTNYYISMMVCDIKKIVSYYEHLVFWYSFIIGSTSKIRPWLTDEFNLPWITENQINPSDQGPEIVVDSKEDQLETSFVS